MDERRIRRSGAARLLGLLLLGINLGACAGARESADEQAAAIAVRAHENLNSVLWTQTAAEYRAVAQQTYAAARRMLDSALTVPSWTAAVEQDAMGNYQNLPPAVVLDVDETVLDNAAYQARLVQQNAEYDRTSWQAWVREERATPVPGAVAFTQYAQDQGVTVFYLTNRRHDEEAATRANLDNVGFPLDPDVDTVIMRGEQPAWDASDKTTRREAIARDYRILLLVGDNLGDFMSEVNRSVEARAALVEPYEAYWGTRWFMLPNPQYGSWEGALYNSADGLSREEKLERKYEALETQ